jgi:hypothetical protein
MPYSYLHYLRLRFNLFPPTHCSCCNHGSDLLHSEYIDRLENLRRRSMKSCKRDWPRKLIGSRIFIKSHNFIKSLRKKKKGKEVAPPLQERPSRKRDWPGKLIKALRKKKGRQVEIPLQERGEDGV